MLVVVETGTADDRDAITVWPIPRRERDPREKGQKQHTETLLFFLRKKAFHLVLLINNNNIITIIVIIILFIIKIII